MATQHFNNISWTEGMILRPQHFQQQHRYYQYLLSTNTHFISPHAYGIHSLSFDRDALALGQLLLEKLECRFPDGTVLSIPRLDLAPASKLVAKGLANKIIYIGIPTNHQYDQKKHVIERDHIAVKDMLGGDETSIEVEKLRPTLLLESDNLNGYVLIPIAKIYRVDSNGVIFLDEDYLPISLHIKNKAFNKLLSKIEILLSHRAKELSLLVSNLNKQNAYEISELMQLEVLNRYEISLNKYIDSEYVTPLKVYELLLSLIGDLSTYVMKNHRPPAVPSYETYQINTVFQELSKIIQGLLTKPLEKSAHEMVVTKHQHGMWSTKLDPSVARDNQKLILAVQADMPSEVIRSQFPQQTKVVSAEQIKGFILRGLPGIEIEPITSVPRHIQFTMNATYFTFNQKHQLWKKVLESGHLAIHISGQYPNLDLKLWAIKRG